MPNRTPTATPRSRVRGEANTARCIVRLLAIVNVRLAATLAMRIWRMTRRYPMPPRELAWLQTAQQRWMHWERRRICLRQWGDPNNPPILLVHGWAGRGSQMGGFVAPLLAQGFSVLAPDLPGHGESAGRSTDAFECCCLFVVLRDQYG